MSKDIFILSKKACKIHRLNMTQIEIVRDHLYIKMYSRLQKKKKLKLKFEIEIQDTTTIFLILVVSCFAYFFGSPVYRYKYSFVV